MQPTDVNDFIIRYFEPVGEFDKDFDNDAAGLSVLSLLQDVRFRFDLGPLEPTYATSGRRLLKLGARNGAQVFLRNAQLTFPDDDTVQITFRRDEQLTPDELLSKRMAGEMQARTALFEKLRDQTLEEEEGGEDLSGMEYPDDEEDTPVFVLWQGGNIEEFKNRDDAQDEIMAMGGRGLSGQIFEDEQEARDTLKGYAEAYNKNDTSDNT